jgi:hypothetical protein
VALSPKNRVSKRAQRRTGRHEVSIAAVVFVFGLLIGAGVAPWLWRRALTTFNAGVIRRLLG